MKETLKAIGFSEKEAIVYLACLEQGRSNASRIAEQTGIQRTDCFAVAIKMVGKGFLVRERIGKLVLFGAVPPKKVLASYEQPLESFRSSLPELEAFMREQDGKKPSISYYEGPAGLEKISREASFSGGELLVFTAKEFMTRDDGLYQKKHIAERMRHRTKCRTIVGMSSEALIHKKEDADALRETRMVPTNLFDAETTVGIYKGRVFVIDYRKRFGFIVEDEHFANTLTQIFELIWNSGRIVISK